MILAVDVVRLVDALVELPCDHRCKETAQHAQHISERRDIRKVITFHQIICLVDIAVSGICFRKLKCQLRVAIMAPQRILE